MRCVSNLIRLFFCDEARLDPSDLRGQAFGARAADTTTVEAERAIRFLVGAQMSWGNLSGRASKEVPNAVVENPQLLSVELQAEKLANYRNDTTSPEALKNHCKPQCFQCVNTTRPVEKRRCNREVRSLDGYKPSSEGYRTRTLAAGSLLRTGVP